MVLILTFRIPQSAFRIWKALYDSRFTGIGEQLKGEGG
jgi:hypothetical protein